MLAGRLTVGASATLGVYFLPELIARFHSAHPQVEVDLVVANKERVEAGLREHVFALGFVEGHAVFPPPAKKSTSQIGPQAARRTQLRVERPLKASRR